MPGLPDLLISHSQAAPALDVPVGATALVYLWAARSVRGRWPVRRTLAFLAGLGSIVVAVQSGLGAYDDVLLSAHMVQHIILLLLAPLLLLWGRPVVLALRALPRRGRAGVGRALTGLHFLGHWAVGLAVFYAVVLVPHLPVLYDASLRHSGLHDLLHLVFLAGGLIFMWPLFGAPARRGALGSVGALCYVIASMPSCALAGAYLNQAGAAVYAPYMAVDHALGVSALADQRRAGAIMWVGAHVILTFVALWVLGSKLVAEERRQRVRDALEEPSPFSAAGPQGAVLS